jgi:GNAT superfamily N-acetyltransferase
MAEASLLSFASTILADSSGGFTFFPICQLVRRPTGKTWEAWIALLDKEGAGQMSHKEIAALLLDKGYIEKGSEWWAQTVTVGYEYAKGRRVIGHIFFSPVEIETGGRSRALTVMALGPMAVLPERQRQGLGSGLVRKGLRT